MKLNLVFVNIVDFFSFSILKADRMNETLAADAAQ